MNNQPTNVTTGDVRFSYVNLFTPRAAQVGQEAKYSVTILIPKSDVATKQRIDAAMQAAYEKGVQSSWNGARPPLKSVVHDGDGVRPSGEPFGPECKGHWVVTASSKQPQQVVDLQLNQIIDQTKVYSGVYGRVNINFYPYSNSGNRGVAAGLGPVQIIRDGEPLGGMVSAEQAFGNAPAPAQPVQTQFGYGQPAAAAAPPQTPYAPVPPQQPYAQPGYGYGQPAQIDPITGKPITGGVWGL